MISLAIMAHPSRRTMIEAKTKVLPGAEVIWDRGPAGSEWDTGRRALLAYDPAASWHAVIQDDAIVPAHFTDALELIVANANDHPIGLYVGRCRPAARLITKAVRAAHASGSPWLEMPGGPWWGVGICLPVATIPSLVAAADRFSHPLYDARVKRAYKLAGAWARYPIPSLLDHDPEIPSLLDSAGGNRRAHDYIGARDAREIPWDAEPVRVDLRGRITVPPGT